MYNSLWEPTHGVMEHCLLCRITQCYLPPDAGEHTPPTLTAA